MDTGRSCGSGGGGGGGGGGARARGGGGGAYVASLGWILAGVVLLLHTGVHSQERVTGENEGGVWLGGGRGEVGRGGGKSECVRAGARSGMAGQ